jgi:predicted DNA-binding transcriptional regulator AlpA
MIKSKSKQQKKPAAKATPKPVSLQEARERKSALLAGTDAPAADKPQLKPASRLKFVREHRLAKLLGVHPSTVWRWRKNNTLPPASRVGRIVGWWENELVDVLAQHRLDPEQEEG